ncbi:Zinc finger family protein [Zostera marina]|uniref:Zinc finger family protein n=1 Tax=Zostera marina TaxID=29655 RepID=A0A0K9P7U6_ZOSMR|nr:Zinc finger family protein [Zostera marina]
MGMEAVYDGSVDDYSSHSIMKGKRTKRRRNFNRSPMSTTTTTTTVSTTSSGSDISGSRNSTDDTITKKEEEDEEMANCLILLAQGRGLITGDTDIGRCVYQCTTCDKSFPSFQALGGHRTSHKKPKTSTSTAVMMIKGKNKSTQEESSLIKINNILLSPFVGGTKSKVHRCSICGSEFSSGQALGGHMRRHRSTMVLEEKKEKKLVFGLDLNLPAPSEIDMTVDPSSPSIGYHCILPILAELPLLSKLSS